jgi:CBS-domain-containing membrane protein
MHKPVGTGKWHEGGKVDALMALINGRPLWTFTHLLGGYAAKIRSNSGPPVKTSSRSRIVPSLVSLAGALIGISAIGYITSHFSLPLLMAPFGASAVLLFSVHDSPLAQPRSTILGHVLSAFTGGVIAIAHTLYFGNSIPESESYLWIAISVAISISAMQISRLTHPPAGATAFIASTAVSDLESLAGFMIPVIIGALVLVVVTIIFNNAIPSRKYPAYW